MLNGQWRDHFSVLSFGLKPDWHDYLNSNTPDIWYYLKTHHYEEAIHCRYMYCIRCKLCTGAS